MTTIMDIKVKGQGQGQGHMGSLNFQMVDAVYCWHEVRNGDNDIGF